ncbi:unnamed protein product [Lepeophtheirus salmonis]|uniref:(salmon louse) hypothetical protein n=1 Tax=Lepeophtheirus salmonis TaxID=72036 RepID=A0A7R8CID2_LEPSM|nr:unnamed protein product [Lepeophtheirus salmonis]CAF2830598.1 unnamed protein product [Lepeophtheirus salmonis]
MMSGLPVIISGERKIVVGISPITEVSHILEVLQKAYGLKIPTRSLTILERWREIEKPLRNSELIYDRWNSWDAEKSTLEKESRKLEKQYKKLLNLRICDEEDDPSSSGFSSAVSYDNDSSLDEASETFV